MKVQVDVWGGENSCTLVARYAVDLPKEADRVASELADGYLVNLLAVHEKQHGSWRDTDAFDFRAADGQPRALS